MSSFPIPEGIGYIVRTASKEMTKTALSKDLRYLLSLWKEIKKRGQTVEAPAIVYTEQDILAKFLRDNFNSDIKEIWLDTKEAYEQVTGFLDLLPAGQRKTKVRLYQDAKPIFNHYDIEEQIEQIYSPVVTLPSGGSIVINPTEALVAIDVNSGRTAKDKNFSETIFLVNMEAAAELARQLRLRDLGGLIVVDFIDMRSARHIREVEKQVKLSMKHDRAKVDISRISKFGLMQISRQKMGAPVQMGSYKICEHCQGRGMIRSVENQAVLYLRQIHTGVANRKVVKVNCRLPVNVAQYLLNMKREELIDLEKRYEVAISVEAAPDMRPGDNQIEFVRSSEGQKPA
jgi:ribonuclease E